MFRSRSPHLGKPIANVDARLRCWWEEAVVCNHASWPKFEEKNRYEMEHKGPNSLPERDGDLCGVELYGVKRFARHRGRFFPLFISQQLIFCIQTWSLRQNTHSTSGLRKLITRCCFQTSKVWFSFLSGTRDKRNTIIFPQILSRVEGSSCSVHRCKSRPCSSRR